MTEKSEVQKPAIDKAGIFSLREAVAQDARRTSYPGATNGPADAYRHLVGIAEMRRRYGFLVARSAGKLNELDVSDYGASQESDSQMDLKNNEIAEKNGAIARNFEEVKAMAHAEIRAAAIEGGTGKNGTAVYLAPNTWDGDRGRETILVWPPRDLADSSEVERILGKPTDLWTAEDARKVQQDSIYRKSTHPRQAEAFEKVRQSFEHRFGKRAENGGKGGDVHVRAYTRGDGTDVGAHSRSAPGPG